MFQIKITRSRMFHFSIHFLLLYTATSFTNESISISTSYKRRRIFHSYRFLTSLDGFETEGRGRKEQSIPEFNILNGQFPDNEKKPSRRLQKSDSSSYSNKLKDSTSLFDKWGVEIIADPSLRPKCPDTIELVAESAFHAISSTLNCKNRLDPNIIDNLRAVSVTDKRPIAFAYWPEGRDVGRLGIEIDGLRYLKSFKKENTSYDVKMKFLVESDKQTINNPNIPPLYRKMNQHEINMEGRALRRFSIMLASRLGAFPWDAEVKKNKKRTDSIIKTIRPIAIFFNTIRQALLASKELQLLQQRENFHGDKINIYGSIRILALGQDEIPIDMTEASKVDYKGGKKRRKWGTSRELCAGTVTPKYGVVLVIQPSDFNRESNSPSPSEGTVQKLQRLLARGSINQLPVVLVSPRLTEQIDMKGIDQSGYQQSSTYGGIEVSRIFKGKCTMQERNCLTPFFQAPKRTDTLDTS